MTGCGGSYTALCIYKKYRTVCQKVHFKIQIRKTTEKSTAKQTNKQKLLSLLKEHEERLKGDRQE